MKYKPTYHISELDLETWGWIIEHYAGTVDDICELRGIKKRTAYEHIQHWKDRGYFYPKGGFILPAQRTYWECGVPYKFHDLGLDFIRHAGIVTKVEHHLRKREDMVVVSWIGERALRHMRGIEHILEDRKTHIADAEAEILSSHTGVMERVAIEVERTAKGRDVTYRILTILAREYNHVWYFADVTNVYRPLKACIETLAPDDIKKFHLWKLNTITCDPKAPSVRTQV